MLAENFPRQIFFFFFSLASWENEACVHHTVSLSCLFSFKQTEQRSHFLSRKILQQICAKFSTSWKAAPEVINFASTKDEEQSIQFMW